MKTEHFLSAALISGAMLLTACGREPGKETERVNDQQQENALEMNKADDAKEWMNERDEAARELADLRTNMSERLTREEKRLADGIKDAEKRAECQNHIAELKHNLTRVDASLARLNGATDSDWSTIKTESRAVADSTSNWFKRQSEMIDRKTDADADKDGH